MLWGGYKKTFYDNTEKKSLEDNSAKKIKEIDFEFTSTGTPQKNGLAEQVFDTLYSWMRATMAHMGLHESIKSGQFP